MKALVYTKPRSLTYRDEAEPEPRPGEALVRIRAAGICGSDMHAFHGHDPRRVPPLILGHEAAGECLSGRYHGCDVAINPLIACGICEPCSQGRPNLCADKEMIGMNRPGTFAEAVAVPECNLFPLPEGMPGTTAALTEPTATALHGVRLAARASIRPLAECRCLVIGGGAIGLLAALILRWHGVSDPVVHELNPLRRSTVHAAGIERVVDPSSGNVAAEAFHVVVDAVGLPATRASALRAVKPGGVVLSLGLQGNGGELDARKLTLGEITVLGAYTYTPADVRAAIVALHSGALGDIAWMELRALSGGAHAFDDLDGGQVAAAKIVLVPD